MSRSREGRRLGVPVAAAAILMLASCSSGPTRPAALPAPPLVELEMREYRYQSSRAAADMPAGRVNFRFRNVGDQGHQPTLLVLPDDVPPIEEQLKGTSRRNVPTLASNSGVSAGVTGALAVDLIAGQRYAFVCFVKNNDGKEHSQLGMAWEFRAGGEAARVATTTTSAATP